jgi:NifU-like protein involved in Fe-S cluster formation
LEELRWIEVRHTPYERRCNGSRGVLCAGRHGVCTPRRAISVSVTVAVQFKTSGCLMSIALSVVLTVVLNLLIRGCA